MKSRMGSVLTLGGSYAVAAVLTVMPWPEAAQWLRPQWAALVIIYWVLALPQWVGVGHAWLLGLAFDGLVGGVLGQQALAFALIAYICHVIYRRMRMFSVLQQSLFVFVLVGLNQLVYQWVHSLTGTAVAGPVYLLPALSSAVVWPAVFVILRGVRRRYVMAGMAHV